MLPATAKVPPVGVRMRTDPSAAPPTWMVPTAAGTNPAGGSSAYSVATTPPIVAVEPSELRVLYDPPIRIRPVGLTVTDVATSRELAVTSKALIPGVGPDGLNAGSSVPSGSSSRAYR